MRCLGGSDLRLQPNNYFSGNHRFIYIDSLRRSRTSSWRLRYGDAVPWPGSVRDAVYDSQTQAANGQEYVVDELARSGDSRFTSDARMRWQQLKNGRNFSGDRDGDRHIRPNQPYRSCNHNHQLSRAPYSGALTMRHCFIGGRFSNRSQPRFAATSIKCTDARPGFERNVQDSFSGPVWPRWMLLAPSLLRLQSRPAPSRYRAMAGRRFQTRRRTRCPHESSARRYVAWHPIFARSHRVHKRHSASWRYRRWVFVCP